MMTPKIIILESASQRTRNRIAEHSPEVHNLRVEKSGVEIEGLGKSHLLVCSCRWSGWIPEDEITIEVETDAE